MFRTKDPLLALATLGAGLIALASCSPPPAMADSGALDVAPVLDLVQIGPPAVTCISAEVHVDVRLDGHVSGLQASDFSTELVDLAHDSSVPLSNSCFEEVASGDGGTGYYRFCVESLMASTPYYLAIRLLHSPGPAGLTTYVMTAACVDPDASAMDAAADF